MCGRFTLTKDNFDELAEELDAEPRPEDAGYRALYRPRYNIAPTDQHWIVRTKYERRHLLAAKWGLVNSWAADAKGAARQINARSETAMTSRAFREAFESRRCAVPADGFFEWVGAKEARKPVWFHSPADRQLLLFAGLYESWREPKTEKWTRTFTILTTDANETVAPVHDRMPVILPRERLDEWLFVPPEEKERPKYAKEVRDLLVPAEAGVLIATEVSPRANSVKNDDAACLEPAQDRERAEPLRLL
ncbi:MAG: SOS response-associated peptidase [Chloroflexi bacterium]|nr:SOS response-associated peptidase [Chloroflexota bacterium]